MEKPVVPAKIEVLGITMNFNEMHVALPRGPERLITSFHEAHVHRLPLSHGFEERIVFLTKVDVEEAVRGKTPLACGASVAVRSLKVGF